MNSSNKILIFYFSGTGNALAAANWINSYATSIEIESRLINIADNPNLKGVTIEENTLIGFCYPTHGFNAPPIVIKFLRGFPSTNKKVNFFILNTRAGMKISKLFTPGVSGLAFILPLIILISKGYKTVGYRPLDLPSNWISIHPGLRKQVIESIFKRCEPLTTAFISKILSGKKSFNRLYELPIDIAISPIALGYYFYGRYVLSKTFIATNDCNLCGLCDKECPVNAIIIKDGLPYWTYKCESCMHCMNICPQRAIETPHAYTAISWVIAFSIMPPLIMAFFDSFSTQVNDISKLFMKILIYVLGWLFILALYKLLHKLMKFRLFNNIVKYTSLTRLKFWRRYKAPTYYE